MWKHFQQFSQYYLSKGLASASAKSYASGASRYIKFCGSCGILPLPVTEAKLSAFVSSLAQAGLAPSSIRTYLAATRHYQIACGLGDPRIPSMCCLNYILQGIKREKASQSTPCETPRQPITPEILMKLFGVWSRNPDLRKVKMLWAASCLAYFGFLRVGEFTSPGVNAYDGTVHLTVDDVSVDNRQSPLMSSLF